MQQQGKNRSRSTIDYHSPQRIEYRMEPWREMTDPRFIEKLDPYDKTLCHSFVVPPGKWKAKAKFRAFSGTQQCAGVLLTDIPSTSVVSGIIMENDVVVAVDFKSIVGKDYDSAMSVIKTCVDRTKVVTVYRSSAAATSIETVENEKSTNRKEFSISSSQHSKQAVQEITESDKASGGGFVLSTCQKSNIKPQTNTTIPPYLSSPSPLTSAQPKLAESNSLQPNISGKTSQPSGVVRRQVLQSLALDSLSHTVSNTEWTILKSVQIFFTNSDRANKCLDRIGIRCSNCINNIHRDPNASIPLRGLEHITAAVRNIAYKHLPFCNMVHEDVKAVLNKGDIESHLLNNYMQILIKELELFDHRKYTYMIKENETWSKTTMTKRRLLASLPKINKEEVAKAFFSGATQSIKDSLTSSNSAQKYHLKSSPLLQSPVSHIGTKNDISYLLQDTKSVTMIDLTDDTQGIGSRSVTTKYTDPEATSTINTINSRVNQNGTKGDLRFKASDLLEPLKENSEVESEMSEPDVASGGRKMRMGPERHFNRVSATESSVISTYQDSTMCRKNCIKKPGVGNKVICTSLEPVINVNVKPASVSNDNVKKMNGDQPQEDIKTFSRGQIECKYERNKNSLDDDYETNSSEYLIPPREDLKTIYPKLNKPKQNSKLPVKNGDIHQSDYSRKIWPSNSRAVNVEKDSNINYISNTFHDKLSGREIAQENISAIQIDARKLPNFEGINNVMKGGPTKGTIFSGATSKKLIGCKSSQEPAYVEETKSPVTKFDGFDSITRKVDEVNFALSDNDFSASGRIMKPSLEGLSTVKETKDNNKCLSEALNTRTICDELDYKSSDDDDTIDHATKKCFEKGPTRFKGAIKVGLKRRRNRKLSNDFCVEKKNGGGVETVLEDEDTTKATAKRKTNSKANNSGQHVLEPRSTFGDSTIENRKLSQGIVCKRQETIFGAKHVEKKKIEFDGRSSDYYFDMNDLTKQETSSKSSNNASTGIKHTHTGTDERKPYIKQSFSLNSKSTADDRKKNAEIGAPLLTDKTSTETVRNGIILDTYDAEKSKLQTISVNNDDENYSQDSNTAKDNSIVSESVKHMDNSVFCEQNDLPSGSNNSDKVSNTVHGMKTQLPDFESMYGNIEKTSCISFTRASESNKARNYIKIEQPCDQVMMDMTKEKTNVVDKRNHSDYTLCEKNNDDHDVVDDNEKVFKEKNDADGTKSSRGCSKASDDNVTTNDNKMSDDNDTEDTNKKHDSNDHFVEEVHDEKNHADEMKSSRSYSKACDDHVETKSDHDGDKYNVVDSKLSSCHGISKSGENHSSVSVQKVDFNHHIDQETVSVKTKIVDEMKSSIVVASKTKDISSCGKGRTLTSFPFNGDDKKDNNMNNESCDCASGDFNHTEKNIDVTTDIFNKSLLENERDSNAKDNAKIDESFDCASKNKILVSKEKGDDDITKLSSFGPSQSDDDSKDDRIERGCFPDKNKNVLYVENGKTSDNNNLSVDDSKKRHGVSSHGSSISDNTDISKRKNSRDNSKKGSSGEKHESLKNQESLHPVSNDIEACNMEITDAPKADDKMKTKMRSCESKESLNNSKKPDNVCRIKGECDKQNDVTPSSKKKDVDTNESTVHFSTKISDDNTNDNTCLDQVTLGVKSSDIRNDDSSNGVFCSLSKITAGGTNSERSVHVMEKNVTEKDSMEKLSHETVTQMDNVSVKKIEKQSEGKNTSSCALLLAREEYDDGCKKARKSEGKNSEKSDQNKYLKNDVVACGSTLDDDHRCRDLVGDNNKDDLMVKMNSSSNYFNTIEKDHFQLGEKKNVSEEKKGKTAECLLSEPQKNGQGSSTEVSATLNEAVNQSLTQNESSDADTICSKGLDSRVSSRSLFSSKIPNMKTVASPSHCDTKGNLTSENRIIKSDNHLEVKERNGQTENKKSENVTDKAKSRRPPTHILMEPYCKTYLKSSSEQKLAKQSQSKIDPIGRADSCDLSFACSDTESDYFDSLPKGLNSDFVYMLVAQAIPVCIDASAPKIGIKCRHCFSDTKYVEVLGKRRLKSCIQSSFQTHVMQCKKVPWEIKQQLKEMRTKELQEYSKIKASSVDLFFEHMWKELQTSIHHVEQHSSKKKRKYSALNDINEKEESHGSYVVACSAQKKSGEDDNNSSGGNAAAEVLVAKNIKGDEECTGISMDTRTDEDASVKDKKVRKHNVDETVKSQGFDTIESSGLDNHNVNIDDNKSSVRNTAVEAPRAKDAKGDEDCIAASPIPRTDEDTSVNCKKIRKQSVQPIMHLKKQSKKQARKVYKRKLFNVLLNDSTKVVLTEDRGLIPNFIYELLTHFKRIKDYNGNPGIRCVHCQDESSSFKYFPTSLRRLKGCITSSLYVHVRVCSHVSESVKTNLLSLEKNQTKEYATIKPSSSEKFYDKVWQRLEG